MSNQGLERDFSACGESSRFDQTVGAEGPRAHERQVSVDDVGAWLDVEIAAFADEAATSEDLGRLDSSESRRVDADGF